MSAERVLQLGLQQHVGGFLASRNEPLWYRMRLRVDRDEFINGFLGEVEATAARGKRLGYPD